MKSELTPESRVTTSPLANYINLAMIPISIATVFLVLSDVSSPVRVWATVVLFALGPGSGLVQFFRLPDASMQLGLIVAISASVDLLLAQIMLWSHNLSGVAAVCILAGITCIRPFEHELVEPNEPGVTP